MFDNPMPAYDPVKGSGYGNTVRFRIKGARMVAEKIPFNREIGFEFQFGPEGEPQLRFDMKRELVGNCTRGN